MMLWRVAIAARLVDHGGMDVHTGLRERKKLATRATLSQTALRLAVELGLDAITPESIAAAAQVSARTFRNYFSSKEEAVVAGLLIGGSDLAGSLRARPRDEDAWESLRRIVPPVIEAALTHRDQTIALFRMARASPPLLAQLLAVYEAISEDLAQAIADRSGTDARHDGYPHLLAGAAALAMKVAAERYADEQNTRTPAQLVDDALRLLSLGVPAPR